MTDTTDALVIGGGPGGSTIATLLRRKGWRVVLCEKEHHPRFHIGESLLPLNLPVFARLGSWVFSSGVYLAMNSAALGAEAVDAQLRASPSANRPMKKFDKEVRRGLRVFSWLIYRFTSPAIQELFMAPRNVFRIKKTIISVLAGDVFNNRAVKLPLALFKVVYYVTWLKELTRAWSAYRRRRRNVQIHYTDGKIFPELS